MGLKTAALPGLFIVALCSTQAHALEILPDTVDLREGAGNPSPPPIAFVSNEGPDPLFLDSLSVASIQVPDGRAQIVLFFRVGSSGSITEQIIHYNRENQGDTLVLPEQSPLATLPPDSTLWLSSPGFDGCVYCPTAKGAASLAAGDTLKAMLVFHAGTESDSVLFLSIERNPTALDIPPDSRPYTGATDHFDLNGRRLGPHTLLRPWSAVPKP